MNPDVPRFTCPRCERSHDRGYLDGVALRRCLNCGYIGYGHHPDTDVDREIQAEIETANAWNAEHGLPPETTP